jgi:hypothetical protein
VAPLTGHVESHFRVWHLQGQRVINPYESRWFWIVLGANPVFWGLSCLSALLGLDWGECWAHMQQFAAAVHWGPGGGGVSGIHQHQQVLLLLLHSSVAWGLADPAPLGVSLAVGVLIFALRPATVLRHA